MNSPTSKKQRKIKSEKKTKYNPQIDEHEMSEQVEQVYLMQKAHSNKFIKFPKSKFL